MGGSGSGGGGGGSGRVDYPDYMKTVHNDWLDQTGSDTIEASITDVMNAAIGASPYTGANAADPTTPLADAWTAVCAFNTVVDNLDHEADWLSAIAAARSEYDNNIVDSTQIDDDVEAFAQVLQDTLDYVEVPKMKAGYRDANAVLSSAFPIAEAVIRGMGMRDVAKYATELRVKNHFLRAEWIHNAADKMLTSLLQRVTFEQAVAQLSVEAKRIHIVAKKEQVDQDLDIDAKDGRWDLETFKYGGNLLAAIGGGTVNAAGEPTKGQSALGGAMSGAAAGFQLSHGSPIGGAIGGVLGLAASFL
jgi:hypothetical protein